RDGRVRVLFFGRVHRYKGLGHLMEAARRVLAAAPEVRFVIAGTGDDLAPYRTGADPQRVEFIDRYVPDEEVAQLFLDADLVVLPYIAASQSGVLALAAAFSKPAIVTRVGGLPEIVEAGAMGLVVPPADPGALAAAILRLAGDSDERARLGRNAERFAETTISHRTVGARALEIYRAVLAARQSGRRN
ncbi:MAG: glycosyltransferase, partial [Alphaproteobacteria bacterium]